MIIPLHNRIKRFLMRHAIHDHYPLLTGLVAIGCSLAAIPFVPVLIAAVLISPKKWLAITLFTASGSALGGVMVLLIFHHLGWSVVMQSHPEWFESEWWLTMIQWLSEWGVMALAVIAATPFPQSPALLFLAMTDQSLSAMWLALAIGKLAKYGTVAYLVRYFPEKMRLARWQKHRFRRLHNPTQP